MASSNEQEIELMGGNKRETQGDIEEAPQIANIDVMVDGDDDADNDSDIDTDFPSINVDPKQGYRATELKLLSCAGPHMRAFHVAWIGFFMAFLAWFAVAPLLPVIKKDLGLTSEDIFDSNIVSVSATILARFLVGPLCDAYGARRIFAILLVIGSIPTYFLGTIQSASDLIAIRFFIGIIGGAFICTQHWTSVMFAQNVVGTANATAGGWGNLGGGVTQLFMVAIWVALSQGMDTETAWRVSFVFPATLTLMVAFLVWFGAQDAPLGDQYAAHLDKKTHSESRERSRSRTRSRADTNNSQVSVGDNGAPRRTRTLSYTTRERRISFTRSTEVSVSAAWTNTGAWILFLHYATCFGVELTMNNVSATYFHTKYSLSPATAGILASLFGLMNLFARSLGGILSDTMFSKYGMQGRLWTQTATLLLEGVFMISFSRVNDLASSVVLLILFSVAVQMAEGSTYSLVPSIKPSQKGAISGIVGAGGNFGAVIWGLFFRFTGVGFDNNFLYIGIVVAASSLLTPFLRLEGFGNWEFFINSDMKKEPVSKSEVE